MTTHSEPPRAHSGAAHPQHTTPKGRPVTRLTPWLTTAVAIAAVIAAAAYIAR